MRRVKGENSIAPPLPFPRPPCRAGRGVREYRGDTIAVVDTPPTPRPEEERDIDYLVCRQCTAPCYVFEMEKRRLTEAVCTICGNDYIRFFNIGEDLEDE